MDTQTTDSPPAEQKPKGTATYTVGELAGMLGVSERHIHRLKKANEVPGLLKLGGRVLFAKAQIDRWLAGAK